MEEEKQQKNLSEEDKKDIEANKVVTFLSYIGIFCLVPLLLKQKSKFAKFHSKQGLILAIAWFLAWIPILGWIVWVLLIIFSVWGLFNVASGKYVKLPVVGDLAEKLNI